MLKIFLGILNLINLEVYNFFKKFYYSDKYGKNFCMLV